MAMKETEKSLRAYFLVMGGISILATFFRIHIASNSVDVSVAWTLATYIPIFSGFILSVAFVVAGLKLKAALPTGARWIKTMLVWSGAMIFVNGALATSILGTHRGSGSITSAAISLAITIYLHRSIARLAADAAAREGIPTPPPAAKVV
ncbi:MAG: hypothetical protein JWO36_3350 [Myxococcales bacterium]|nr:hypothetical protein [Myxococcales bacterium]